MKTLLAVALVVLLGGCAPRVPSGEWVRRFDGNVTALRVIGDVCLSVGVSNEGKSVMPGKVVGGTIQLFYTDTDNVLCGSEHWRILKVTDDNLLLRIGQSDAEFKRYRTFNVTPLVDQLITRPAADFLE